MRRRATCSRRSLLQEATNALKADKEAQEAALAQMEEVHKDRVAALEAARDDLTERLAEVQEGPCARRLRRRRRRARPALNDADSVVNELHARVASLETERDDALKTGHDTSSTLRATVARLGRKPSSSTTSATPRTSGALLRAQLASLAEARDEAQEAQEVRPAPCGGALSELEAAAGVDAHEAEEKLRRIAELEQKSIGRRAHAAARCSRPVAGDGRAREHADAHGHRALVDAETAASQRVRDLQIELRSRDDDAFRLRRELEAARADAERAK